MDIVVKASPLDLLFGYQRRWVDDDARFKIGLMSRQVGKDFSSGAEGVRDCALHEIKKSKTGWMIAAPSERQSLASLDKWKEWAQAFNLAIADIQEKREGGSETLLKSSTIVFPYGSSVIAVPGKPDTVRGESRNVLLTEFGFFEQPDETWRALYATVANPLRGGQKKIRLISTPNGQGNKLHAIWAKNFGKSQKQIMEAAAGIVPPHVRDRIEQALAAAPKSGAPLTANEAQMHWSCHLVTIYDAVRDGLPANLYELYAGMDDPEGWAQEFECEFLDAASVLLPYELIATCESSEATTTISPEYYATKTPRPISIGWDFARKRDLSVPWIVERVGDVLHTREIVEFRGMSTPAQFSAMKHRIAVAQRVCVDYTGPGIGLGDMLVDEFGEYKPDADKFGKIELCTFTNSMKLELFPALKVAFEQRRVRVPVNRAVREDLHAMQRVVTSAGNVSYRAPHTEDGHSDRCTALALAVRAAGSSGGVATMPRAFTNPALRGRRDRSVTA